MDLNTVLIIACFAGLIAFVIIAYNRAKARAVKVESLELDTQEKLLKFVQNSVMETVSEDYKIGLDNKEYDRLSSRKALINSSLKNCVHGIDGDKELTIILIRYFLVQKAKLENIKRILGFVEGKEPSDHVKFEIILYKYKKAYGKDALIRWIDDFGFSDEREIEGDINNQGMGYFINSKMLNDSYRELNYDMNDDEFFDIEAVLLFQAWKGFGIVDTIREMNINGLLLGTTGSIMHRQSSRDYGIYTSSRCVRLHDRGRYIHLSFLDFGSEEEVQRIVQMMIRWGNPGPLTAKRGYIVNSMYDKTRITALRPPASEYWGCFLRKFTLQDQSPEWLIDKEYTNKAYLAIKLLQFLMKGCITCGVTGVQGSGKTTLMASIVRYISPKFNIRVLEMAPELYLRELYPSRDIFSVSETSTLTAAELQSILKKTDSAVSIVGEVADPVMATRMIEMGMTGSIFTLFSHHANRAKDLILALRNDLTAVGNFSNSSVAERQVTEVVKMDVHLERHSDGGRYIMRFTEIVQLDEGIPYPEIDPNDVEASMGKITAEYYRRQTDRQSFDTVDIMRYDLDTHTFIPCERLSKELEDKLRNNLNRKDRAEFDWFMMKEWGPRKGSPEASYTPEQLEEVITQLEVEAFGYSKKDSRAFDLGVEVNTYVGNKVENEAAADTELWTKGYLADVDSQGADMGEEYSIGELFSGEDYE